jgi:hypothetical protein
VELAPLKVVHLHERRLGDDPADTAAQRDARHWRSLEPAGLSGGEEARVDAGSTSGGQYGATQWPEEAVAR